VIIDCPNFVGFLREGLAAPNMTYLGLINCEKMKSLPGHMNTLLPKLKCLCIRNCPEIDSFPEGGLPLNLGGLVIMHCEKLLSKLPSIGDHDGLTSLHIGGASSESASWISKEGLLPHFPSLEKLRLQEFENLETLDCKGLLRLTSLRFLKLKDCPKLQNMAGERLPSSLTYLKILGCDLLRKQCQEKPVQIWPKISHIRSIRIDRRWIRELWIGLPKVICLLSTPQYNFLTSLVTK
jgi:hypothetical protein